MEIQEIKQQSIVDYLQREGYSPTKIKGNNYWYRSPLRQEQTPSFKVNAERNIWYDFGTGQHGDIIDLVCAMKRYTFAEALNKLSDKPQSSFSFGGNIIEKEKPMELCAISSLSHPPLLAYLTERGIPQNIAKRYCKEIHYKAANRNYFAVGFGNDAGGWELRSPCFKGCYAPKAISTFSFGDSHLKLFEGFMDFFSDVVINGEPKSDVIVLNSLSLLPRITDKLSAYSQIECCLDNDTAGRKAYEILRVSCPQAVNCSENYRGYKDLNEQLMEMLKNKNKSVLPQTKQRGMKI